MVVPKEWNKELMFSGLNTKVESVSMLLQTLSVLENITETDKK